MPPWAVIFLLVGRTNWFIDPASEDIAPKDLVILVFRKMLQLQRHSMISTHDFDQIKVQKILTFPYMFSSIILQIRLIWKIERKKQRYL